jgi:hypothetical protein
LDYPATSICAMLARPGIGPRSRPQSAPERDVEDLGATTLAQERRAVDYDIIIKIRIATYGKSGFGRTAPPTP